ncbi:MAG TPA: HD domain-containing protein [Candidatus Hydrogenedens sp.]|nr:HD domain-containing protein [Candidatus Hydrogenedens sp.]
MIKLNKEKVLSAIDFAMSIHEGQTRKGKDIPYLTHLLTVASRILEEGGDEEQFIAGLLHDSVEDKGGAPLLEEIEQKFGKKVANYVEQCSDSFSFPKKPWKERKVKFIEQCRQLPADVKLIIACDKWHNLYTTYRDFLREGDNVWTWFKGGKEGTLWYYQEIIYALRQNWQSLILSELEYYLNYLLNEAKG